MQGGGSGSDVTYKGLKGVPRSPHEGRAVWVFAAVLYPCPDAVLSGIFFVQTLRETTCWGENVFGWRAAFQPTAQGVGVESSGL